MFDKPISLRVKTYSQCHEIKKKLVTFLEIEGQILHMPNSHAGENSLHLKRIMMLETNGLKYVLFFYLVNENLIHSRIDCLNTNTSHQG